MLVDVHAHLDVEEFDKDREEVLRKCRIVVVNAGVDLKSSMASLNMARSYPNVVPAVGLHPEFVEKADLELEKVLELIKDAPIISEVGLDFYWIKEEKLRKKQVEMLGRFMEEGERQRKALVIHSRGGLRDILEMVTSYKVKFVIHAYEGSIKDAIRVHELGGFVSIPPIIVRDKVRRTVAEKIPLESILTETDSPFMGPDRYRNEPCNVAITLMELAKLRKQDVREIEEKIQDNFKGIMEPYFSLSGANLTNK